LLVAQPKSWGLVSPGPFSCCAYVSGMVCYPWARTCYDECTYRINLKSLYILTLGYEDTKGDTKCGEWGGLGLSGLRATQGSEDSAPFDRAHTIFYSLL